MAGKGCVTGHWAVLLQPTLAHTEQVVKASSGHEVSLWDPVWWQLVVLAFFFFLLNESSCSEQWLSLCLYHHRLLSMSVLLKWTWLSQDMKVARQAGV